MIDYPFLDPGFLGALEHSGAVSAARGWRPVHLRADDFFMPLYLRDDSWGEFVFDQSWAAASARAGIRYYPRLVTAVPFTPVPGPRWRGTPEPERLWTELRASLASLGATSWHLLFPDHETRAALAGLPLVSRQACHFRWHNRGYGDFEDFLGTLKSRRRKELRKERERVRAQGLEIVWRVGRDIPSAWWPDLYRCYAGTYLERGQHPYLPAEFFTELASSTLADQLAVVAAFDGSGMAAAAFYLFDERTLYGRYWGSVREHDGLHFELCYYRGIEFCIARGLSRFDPGVQGEHKILRGFEPELTWSLHWLEHGGLRQAVARFCAEEAELVRAYREQARALLPYRSDR